MKVRCGLGLRNQQALDTLNCGSLPWAAVSAKLAALLAFLIFVCPPTLAQVGETPMTFDYEANGGNCAGCEWINASGEIVPGTTDRFEEEFGVEGTCPVTIELSSSGGSLLEAIKLGRAIRQRGCRTSVGEAGCYSACAYAFLGGKIRWAMEGELGIHQHYREDAVAEPLRKSLTAIDLSASQMLTGLLVAYVIEMGVDARLVTIASLVAPSEELYALTRRDLEDLKVVTDVPVSRAEWKLLPMRDGLIARNVQKQSEWDEVQTFEISCSAATGMRALQIAIPLGTLEDRVKGEIDYWRVPVILSTTGFKVAIKEPTFAFSGPANDRLMTITIPIDQLLARVLNAGGNVDWSRDASRASERFFRGWFDVTGLEPFADVVFRNCTHE